MKKLVRLLEIINLVQVSPGITASELTERCEITERTLYRDLDLLNAANIPIVSQGRGKGYAFLGNFKLYPLNFTEDERQALSILPTILHEKFQTIPFYQALEKVLATDRAEAIDQRQFANHLSKVIQIKGTHASDDEQHDILSKMSEAVLRSKTIKATYHSRNSKTRQRKLDPYFLVPRDNQLYILGFCHEHKMIRTFRLNRFEKVIVLDETFEKYTTDVEGYLKNTWSIIRGEDLLTFKVRFSKEVANLVKEADYNVEPKFTDQEDGSLLFEVTVNDSQELIRWIMPFGADAEIIEPIKYRESFKETLKKWQAQYE